MRSFDHLAVNQRLLLSLPFYEGTGTVTRDWAKPDHEMTLNGVPIWRPQPTDLMVLDFDSANPDFLDCPAVDTADLDFIAGAFSVAAWINLGGVGYRFIFCRGLVNVDGWHWAINADSGHTLATQQVGANQYTESADDVIPIADWVFLAATRNAANVYMYVNGVRSIGVTVAHVNPVTAARELHVGIDDAENAGFYDGLMWNPRIWDYDLAADSIRFLFEKERDLFAV